MPDWVRVRAENGSETTMSAERAEASKLTPLKSKPAVGRDGRPLPDKPRVPLGGAAAETNTAPDTRQTPRQKSRKD